jgi:hypothetical protein
MSKGKLTGRWLWLASGAAPRSRHRSEWAMIVFAVMFLLIEVE